MWAPLAPGPGVVLALRIVNTLDQPIVISRLVPVADEHLQVTYVGHSTCERGCPGAMRWDDEAIALVDRGSDGVYPIPVPPMEDLIERGERTPSLIFRLQVTTPAGVQKLARECLHLRAVRAVVGDDTVTVTYSDGRWVAGLNRLNPPRTYRDC